MSIIEYLKTFGYHIGLIIRPLKFFFLREHLNNVSLKIMEDTYLISLFRNITFLAGGFPEEEVTKIASICQYISTGVSQKEAIDKALNDAKIRYPPGFYEEGGWECIRDGEAFSAFKINSTEKNTICIFYTAYN